jgi:hypothetical protein
MLQLLYFMRPAAVYGLMLVRKKKCIPWDLKPQPCSLARSLPTLTNTSHKFSKVLAEADVTLQFRKYDMQYAYKVSLERVRVTIFAVEEE